MHGRVLASVVEWEWSEYGMSVFRIQLADGEKTLKADLKAFDESGARIAAEKWFSGAHWQIVGIRQLAD
jgi:hypothetical protein